jgi:hypothetical protein
MQSILRLRSWFRRSNYLVLLEIHSHKTRAYVPSCGICFSDHLPFDICYLRTGGCLFSSVVFVLNTTIFVRPRDLLHSALYCLPLPMHGYRSLHMWFFLCMCRAGRLKIRYQDTVQRGGSVIDRYVVPQRGTVFTVSGTCSSCSNVCVCVCAKCSARYQSTYQNPATGSVIDRYVIPQRGTVIFRLYEGARPHARTPARTSARPHAHARTHACMHARTHEGTRRDGHVRKHLPSTQSNHACRLCCHRTLDRCPSARSFRSSSSIKSRARCDERTRAHTHTTHRHSHRQRRRPRHRNKHNSWAYIYTCTDYMQRAPNIHASCDCANIHWHTEPDPEHSLGDALHVVCEGARVCLLAYSYCPVCLRGVRACVQDTNAHMQACKRELSTHLLTRTYNR